MSFFLPLRVSKTTGEGDPTNSPKLEFLAKVGGLLFIVGSFLLGSALLFILLFELFGPDYGVVKSDVPHILIELNPLKLIATLVGMVVIGAVFSRFFEINIFGFSQFYRNRIVRCYLGATRWVRGKRKPNEFTKFDFRDDLGLWRLRTDSPGEGIKREGDRDDFKADKQADGECTPYRGPFANGVQLGQAVAVSGAAVSSNMGYNTSPLVAFLLTMFNVRLGWWFPNPGQDSWNRRGLSFSLKCLVAELFGMADDKSKYVNVTDGGHFENLGVYELVRRRCKLIIACDAECDEQMQFGSLGKMIRLCQTDFGATIDLDVKSIRPQANGYSVAHCAAGIIKYCTGEIGYSCRS